MSYDYIKQYEEARKRRMEATTKMENWEKIDHPVAGEGQSWSNYGEKDLEPEATKTFWFTPNAPAKPGRCGPTHSAKWTRDEFIAALQELPVEAYIDYSYCEGYDEHWGFYCERAITEEEKEAVRTKLRVQEEKLLVADRESLKNLLRKHPEWAKEGIIT